ncbi:MAG: sterol desaturase family protein [Verrucomicrobiota bacterium]
MHQYLLFLLILILWLPVSSFVEWAFHRYVMHRPFGLFAYPFRDHALGHHRVFRADHTYHLSKPADRGAILMGWWSGPVLSLIGALPALPLALASENWVIYWGAASGAALYYCAYQYLHWCMHVPKGRTIEKKQWFRRLNAHHLLHHRYMHRNFNVVLPLADVLLGTFIERARTRFTQPNSPAVPDVQPVKARVSAEVRA